MDLGDGGEGGSRGDDARARESAEHDEAGAGGDGALGGVRPGEDERGERDGEDQAAESDGRADAERLRGVAERGGHERQRGIVLLLDGFRVRRGFSDRAGRANDASPHLARPRRGRRDTRDADADARLAGSIAAPGVAVGGGGDLPPRSARPLRPSSVPRRCRKRCARDASPLRPTTDRAGGCDPRAGRRAGRRRDAPRTREARRRRHHARVPTGVRSKRCSNTLANGGTLFRASHFAGRAGCGWEMTTEWRPDIDRLLASVAEMEGADAVKAEVEADDGDGANQGTKRKRAPRTKGPCEHGVKPRSRCKVCSACPQYDARGGGASICEHGRIRSVQGVRWVSNLRARSYTLQVQGVRWVSNLRARSYTLSVQGVRRVWNLRARSQRWWCSSSALSAVGLESASTVVVRRSKCKECGGSAESASTVSALSARSAVGLESASTVVSALSARSAVGSQICEHGRQRSQCKECGGSRACLSCTAVGAA